MMASNRKLPLQVKIYWCCMRHMLVFVDILHNQYRQILSDDLFLVTRAKRSSGAISILGVNKGRVTIKVKY
jgi:hypothetical protein